MILSSAARRTRAGLAGRKRLASGNGRKRRSIRPVAVGLMPGRIVPAAASADGQIRRIMFRRFHPANALTGESGAEDTRKQGKQGKMTTKTTETKGGLRVTPIDWQQTIEVLKPKYDAGDHWILVAHILASPLITTIEQKYYLGDKNADFTLITTFWRGQAYALVAARKRWMQGYQLAS